jgi:hypothetical protein
MKSHLLGKGLALPYNHQARLERLAKDKHSSLLRTFVNYNLNDFLQDCPWTRTTELGNMRRPFSHSAAALQPILSAKRRVG